MRRRILGWTLTVLGAAGCAQGNLYPNEPFLEFVSIAPETLYVPDLRVEPDAQIPELKITVKFRDGDGDLGGDAGGFVMQDLRPGLPVVVFRDTYDGRLPYALPNLTPATRPPSIQGSITVTYSGYIPIIERDSSEEDLIFDIYVRDRAGHVSPKVRTSPVRLIRKVYP
ncbi:MAG: hypothetical protein RMM53_11515 [Bacteroidia bacterium]|nr:hypothetical protein [Bacteroidia bacterium]